MRTAQALLKRELRTSEPVAVFARDDERLDHFSVDEVAIELVQLRQPEVVTVEVCVWQVVRRSPQIAEVLHQHESLREFPLDKIIVLIYASQYLGASLHPG